MNLARRIALLAGCLVISFLPGVVGGQFEPGAWYAALDKPPLTPPGWVFPIAWTALYAAMGVALYLVITAPGPVAWGLLAVFALQLVLNGAWSWLFFGLQRPGAALADLAALWLAIAWLTVAFWRRRPIAGALFLPYLLWVSFAGYLNAGIWLLNR